MFFFDEQRHPNALIWVYKPRGIGGSIRLSTRSIGKGSGKGSKGKGSEGSAGTSSGSITSGGTSMNTKGHEDQDEDIDIPALLRRIQRTVQPAYIGRFQRQHRAHLEGMAKIAESPGYDFFSPGLYGCFSFLAAGLKKEESGPFGQDLKVLLGGEGGGGGTQSQVLKSQNLKWVIKLGNRRTCEELHKEHAPVPRAHFRTQMPFKTGDLGSGF